MKTQRVIAIAAIASALILTGCTANTVYSMCTTGNVSTKLKSYSAKHDYKSVMIFNTGEFPGYMCNELAQHDVSCMAYDQVFSPLEDYTEDQIRARLLDGSFDAVLFVNEAGSNTDSYYLGSVSAFNTYGAGGTVTTANLRGFARADSLGVVVYDTETDKRVYLADAATSGAGSACVNDYVYLRSAAEAITADMLK